MFVFFIENDLISQHHSSFKPGDSCINQLLSVNHEVYQLFDEGFDVRSVFLDISKAFDKGWHDIIFRLKQNGIVEALRKRPLAKKYSTIERLCVRDLFQVLNLWM